MGKYSPLRDHLVAKDQIELTMTFAEVEKLVESLPPSAHNNRAWWANDNKVQAQAWKNAGWRVRSVDLQVGRVVFERNTETASPNTSTNDSETRDERPAASLSPITGEDKSDRARRNEIWPASLVAIVGAIGTGVVTILPISIVPRWAAFLIALDISLTATALTTALTKPCRRIAALVASNALLVLLIGGVAMYNIIPTVSTANVVPNRDVTFSNEAGGQPDSTNPYATELSAGVGATATCYTTIRGSIWLFFHFSDTTYGWAPFDQFSYEPGFPHHLPETCP